jgi:hypothetical protein
MVECGRGLVHLPEMSLQPRSTVTQMMFFAAGITIRMICEKAAEIWLKTASEVRIT